MNRGRILIIASSFLYGSSTISTSFLAKRGLSSLDISFFFTFLSVLPLLPVVGNRKLLRKIRDQWRYVISYSLVSATLIISIFESIVLGLSPGIVSFLTYTQPFWTIIFGRLLFGERIVKRRIGIIVLAFGGIFLVTDPISGFAVSTSNPNLPVAYALAIFSGVSLSLWVILGKKGEAKGFDNPVELTFVIRSGSAIIFIFTGLFSRLLGMSVFFSNVPSLESNLIIVILFSILTGLLPDLLFYSGVKSVNALQAGLILLIEPVFTAAASVVLRISTFDSLQIIGGGLILVANYYALTSMDRDQSPTRISDSELHDDRFKLFCTKKCLVARSRRK